MIRVFLRKKKQNYNKKYNLCYYNNNKILINKKEILEYINYNNTRNINIKLGNKKYKCILETIRNYLHNKEYIICLKKKRKINKANVKISLIFEEKKIFVKHFVNFIEVFSKKNIPNIIEIKLNKKKDIYTTKDIKIKNIFFKKKMIIVKLLK
ncbi:hypothetical protein ACWNYQ_00135 [Candidatus Vidania fulgoroideorum]